MHLKVLFKASDKQRCFGISPKMAMVMKLTCFLMLVGCLQVSAAALGQKVTITGKQVTLRQVFKQIREQTGYNFIYSNKTIREATPVTLDVKDVSVQEALNQVFAGQPLSYVIEDKIIIVKTKYVISGRARFPDKEIKGKVTDSTTGRPLPGITVRVKGTNNGAVTDDNGNFKLNIAGNTILVVSGIGYLNKEMFVGGKVKLQIKMEKDVAGLNQIVVTAYGQEQTKVSVTGAISTIRTKELKQSPVANLSNALAGRLPGLTTIQTSGLPGSDASQLYIRGVSTYGADKSPLIVIDGLPRGDANFGDLDVNEIASISILKDASATSLYGIQGANGVILVTTKRGKIGKPTIQFNAEYSLQSPSRLPTYLDPYHSALLDNEGMKNDGQPSLWTDQQLQIMKDKSEPYMYPDVDWYDVILKKLAPQQEYNLNITGGNKTVTYFVSGSYLNQGSLLNDADDNKYGVKDQYSRYNFRSNIDINVSKSLKLRLDLASRLENRTGPGPGYSWVFTMLTDYSYGTTPVYNPDGSYAAGLTMPGD